MNSDNTEENFNNKSSNDSVIQAIDRLNETLNYISKKSATTRENSRIEKWNLLVQMVLATVTVLLFILNAKQTSISADAVAEAKKANGLTETALQQANNKAFNDSIHQAFIDSINSDKDSLNAKLAKGSLEAQIESLQKTQKRFEVENEPNLQAGDFVIDLNETTRRPTIQYNIINMGKNAVNIVNFKQLIIYFPANRSVDPKFVLDSLRKLPFPHSNRNSILFGQISDINKHVGNEMTPVLFNMVKTGEIAMCFAGQFNYKNLITDKNKIYKFVCLMKSGNEGYNLPINENTFK